MNYQQTDYLFDVVMPQVDANAFKIICTVARKTWGWNKNSDTISVSQFMEATGLNSRSTATSAIVRAVESGFINRQKAGQSWSYRMDFYEKPYREPVQQDEKPYRNPVQIYEKPYREPVRLEPVETLETVPATGTTVPDFGTVPYRISDTQTTYQQLNKDITDLIQHFTAATGFYMPGGMSEIVHSKWIKPLEAIAGQGDAKERIDYAVQQMREKGYTIKSPQSLMTFALNWGGAESKIAVTTDGGMYV